jgi:hypothetical protein
MPACFLIQRSYRVHIGDDIRIEEGEGFARAPLAVSLIKVLSKRERQAMRVGVAGGSRAKGTVSTHRGSQVSQYGCDGEVGSSSVWTERGRKVVREVVVAYVRMGRFTLPS